MIIFGEDHITIFDNQGEIIHWVEEEWIVDPSVTISIANAIHIFYTEGSEKLREIVSSRQPALTVHSG